MQLSQGQDHQPLSPEGAPRVADVRLSQDRLSGVLASGAVRVSEWHPEPHKYLTKNNFIFFSEILEHVFHIVNQMRPAFISI